MPRGWGRWRPPRLTSCASAAATGRACSTATRWPACRAPTTTWSTSSGATATTSGAPAAGGGRRRGWCCGARPGCWRQRQPVSAATRRWSCRGPTGAGVSDCGRSWSPVGSGGCSADASAAILKRSSANWRNNCSSQLCRPRKKVSGLLTGQGVGQPGAGKNPVPVGRSVGQAQRVGRFRESHPGEEAQLHQLGRRRVVLRQSVERFIQPEQVVVAGGDQASEAVEIHALPAAASLQPVAIASAIHEDAAHGLGRGGEEVTASVELLVTDETQVRLVDQGGGVKGVAGRFGGQARGGEPAQLVVDEGQKIGGSLAVAPGGGFEHSGNVGHSASVTLTAGSGMGKWTAGRFRRTRRALRSTRPPLVSQDPLRAQVRHADASCRLVGSGHAEGRDSCRKSSPRPGVVRIEAGASTCVPDGRYGCRVAVPLPSPDCTAVTLTP